MYMDALMHDTHTHTHTHTHKLIIFTFLSSHRALYIDVLVQNSYMHYIKFIQHKQFTQSIHPASVHLKVEISRQCSQSITTCNFSFQHP